MEVRQEREWGASYSVATQLLAADLAGGYITRALLWRAGVTGPSSGPPLERGALSHSSLGQRSPVRSHLVSGPLLCQLNRGHAQPNCNEQSMQICCCNIALHSKFLTKPKSKQWAWLHGQVMVWYLSFLSSFLALWISIFRVSLFFSSPIYLFNSVVLTHKVTDVMTYDQNGQKILVWLQFALKFNITVRTESRFGISSRAYAAFLAYKWFWLLALSRLCPRKPRWPEVDNDEVTIAAEEAPQEMAGVARGRG